MPVPVAIFNTSSQSIAVTVNNGPQIAVSGTGPAQNWAPQTQAPGTGPTYSRSYPQPNELGNQGQNQVLAFVNGMPAGDPIVFSLPNNYPVGSVQMYLTLNRDQTASWLILADGNVCARQV